MPQCGCFHAAGSAIASPDLAETTVLQAYVRLPLLPRQPDGCWVAPLKRVGHREFRLVESVPASLGQAVLRVELFDQRTKSVIESRACEEVEDAVTAFRKMLPLAPS
jgi:hypothetical protein